MAESHKFGGEWTQEKLTRLQNYLRAYRQALKKTSFRLAYIDAFAGTGYLDPTEDEDEMPWFNTFSEKEPKEFLKGSATIALEIEPPFHQYIFIDRRKKHVVELEKLKQQYPELASRILVRQGEANQEVRELCAKKWGNTHRAVLFLDPYGMQVEWATLEAIAKTQAIDLWLLIPTAIAVNRMITSDGQIPAGWKRRLDLFFGSQDWMERFYATETERNLAGELETTQRQADLVEIENYFLERLQTIFPGRVAKNPFRLNTSDGRPLYLLCFAASNERGAPLAIKMAQHILSR